MRRWGSRRFLFGLGLSVLLCLALAPAVAHALVADSFESDDTSSAARLRPSDGSKEEHTIFPSMDQDWFKFVAISGHTYDFQTGPGQAEPGLNFDTGLWLLDTDGTTELLYNDDAGPRNYSNLRWTAPADGTYYLRVARYAFTQGEGTYALRIKDVSSDVAGSISGTVRAGGVPAAGATVFYTEPWFGALDSWSTVGASDSGTYTIDSLAPGQYAIKFEKMGWLPQYYRLAETYSASTPVILNSGGAVTGVDANLVPIPSIPRVASLAELVSVNSTGAIGDSNSYYPSVSASGRYVAFESYARNLWTALFDSQSPEQVFVRDRVTGVTSCVSVAPDGSIANGACWAPSVSGDGRYVAFISQSSNLVAGLPDSRNRVYVRDRVSGVTTCVSVRTDGSPTEGSSPGLDTRDWPSISGNGRYVAYSSMDTSLVAGDQNDASDIFVWDRLTGATVRASTDADGHEGGRGSRAPSISGDGRYVAFITGNAFVEGDVPVDGGSSDVDVYVKDLTAGGIVRASVPATEGRSGGYSSHPAISADGHKVAFVSEASNLVQDDTNGYDDVFLRDLVANTTVCVSRSLSGEQADDDSYDPSISGDGSIVVFASDASNLVPYDDLGDGGKGRAQGLAAASEDEAGGKSGGPVGFVRAAREVLGGADVFLRDFARGTFGMVSLNPVGRPGDADSDEGTAISSDGHVIAFGSYATNLVGGDTNDSSDVFAATYPLPAPVVGGLGRPWSPYIARKGAYFQCWGTMRPKAKSGLHVVKLKCYRLEDGVWVLKKTSKTLTYNRFWWRYTKYGYRISLPSRGRWRIVAAMGSGSSMVYSDARYLRVR